MGAGLRRAVQATRASRRQPPAPVVPLHQERREQDEIVCRCGLRWPVGETHP